MTLTGSTPPFGVRASAEGAVLRPVGRRGRRQAFHQLQPADERIPRPADKSGEGRVRLGDAAIALGHEQAEGRPIDQMREFLAAPHGRFDRGPQVGQILDTPEKPVGAAGQRLGRQRDPSHAASGAGDALFHAHHAAGPGRSLRRPQRGGRILVALDEHGRIERTVIAGANDGAIGRIGRHDGPVGTDDGATEILIGEIAGERGVDVARRPARTEKPEPGESHSRRPQETENDLKRYHQFGRHQCAGDGEPRFRPPPTRSARPVRSRLFPLPCFPRSDRGRGRLFRYSPCYPPAPVNAAPACDAVA